MFIIRDREAGNEISKHIRYEDAIAALDYYQRCDIIDNIFTPDYYEIVEVDE